MNSLLTKSLNASQPTATAAASTSMPTLPTGGLASAILPHAGVSASLFSANVQKMLSDPKFAGSLVAAVMTNAVMNALVDTPEQKEKKAREEEARKVEQVKAEERKKAEEAVAKQQAENDKQRKENDRLEAVVAYLRRRELLRGNTNVITDPLVHGDYPASASFRSSNDGKA